MCNSFYSLKLRKHLKLPIYNTLQTVKQHSCGLMQVTCFKNLGLTWMLALTVGGSGLMGQAGSTELTRTSSAYSFFRGNTSSHVERNLNRLFLVFSSTYKQRTASSTTSTCSICHRITLNSTQICLYRKVNLKIILGEGPCCGSNYTGAECRRPHVKSKQHKREVNWTATILKQSWTTKKTVPFQRHI